ncbi:unnamed protein product, partial [Phaeothamnion confervicola]
TSVALSRLPPAPSPGVRRRVSAQEAAGGSFLDVLCLVLGSVDLWELAADGHSYKGWSMVLSNCTATAPRCLETRGEVMPKTQSTGQRRAETRRESAGDRREEGRRKS